MGPGFGIGLGCWRLDAKLSGVRGLVASVDKSSAAEARVYQGATRCTLGLHHHAVPRPSCVGFRAHIVGIKPFYPHSHKARLFGLVDINER